MAEARNGAGEQAPPGPARRGLATWLAAPLLTLPLLSFAGLRRVAKTSRSSTFRRNSAPNGAIDHGQVPTPFDFGAHGDGQFVTDAGITAAAASPTIVFSTALFTPADVGKNIYIGGNVDKDVYTGSIGPLGAVYSGKIVGHRSDNSIDVAPSPARSVSKMAKVPVMWGHDDTAAIDAWLAALNGRAGWVPSAAFMTSGGHTLRGNQTIFGFGGLEPVQLMSVGPNQRLPAFLHINPARPLISSESGAQCVLHGVSVIVNNFDLAKPIPGPATIVGLYEVSRCNFLFSYIACAGVWRFLDCYCNFHHRVLHFVDAGDLVYMRNVHSNYPKYTIPTNAWCYINGYMIELDAANLRAEQVFCIGTAGFLLLNGSRPFTDISISQFGAEAVKTGITISSGTLEYQSVNLSQGYIQSNNRPDADYMISNDGRVVLNISQVIFGFATAGQDIIQIKHGLTNISQCRFKPYQGKTIDPIHFFSTKANLTDGGDFAVGIATVSNCQFESGLGNVLVFEADARGCNWGSGNLRGNGNRWISGSPAWDNNQFQVATPGSRNVTIVKSGTSYTATVTDDFISVHLTTASVISLPSAPPAGRRFTIKDGGNNAASYPIRVSTGSAHIDGTGTNTLTISRDGASIDLTFTGSHYEVS